jgi:hypothetical protein
LVWLGWWGEDRNFEERRRRGKCSRVIRKDVEHEEKKKKKKSSLGPLKENIESQVYHFTLG